MSIAKALSSAYLPISAVLLSPELAEIIEEEATRIGVLWHGFTYSAHPVAAAVALKTIEIYQRRDIVGHVRKVAPLFLKRLRALADHPLVGEANGVGLIGAVELVADKKTKRNFEAAKGVGARCNQFCRGRGHDRARIAVGPHRTLSAAGDPAKTRSTKCSTALTRGLDKTLDWVTAEGLF